jgi:hypothetical protein
MLPKAALPTAASAVKKEEPDRTDSERLEHSEKQEAAPYSKQHPRHKRSKLGKRFALFHA